MVLVPLADVTAHSADGQVRWLGRAKLAGRINREVVVLRTPDGLRAVRAHCPHRGVSLLLGRFDVEAGTLECPGHGWQLPLAGEELAALPVVEQDGVLFVQLPD